MIMRCSSTAGGGRRGQLHAGGASGGARQDGHGAQSDAGAQEDSALRVVAHLDQVTHLGVKGTLKTQNELR